MSRVPRRLVALSILLAAATVAAGCGGDGSDEASDTTAQTSTTTAETTTSTATTTAATTGTTNEDTTTTGTSETETEAEVTTGGSSSSDVSRFLFRTKRNTMVCGRDESDLVCFVTRSGVTVTLRPSGRASQAEIKDEHRGMPAQARSAPVLQKGRPITSRPFRCALRKGEVRCTNAAKHGFLLSPTSIFRF